MKFPTCVAAVLVLFAAQSTFSASIVVTDCSRSITGHTTNDFETINNLSAAFGAFDAIGGPLSGGPPNSNLTAFAAQHTQLDVFDDSFLFTGSATTSTLAEVTSLPPLFIFATADSRATIHFTLLQPATYSFSGIFNVFPSTGDSGAILVLYDTFLNSTIDYIGYFNGAYRTSTSGVLEAGDYTIGLSLGTSSLASTSAQTPTLTDDRSASVSDLSVQVIRYVAPEPCSATLMSEGLGLLALRYRRRTAGESRR